MIITRSGDKEVLELDMTRPSRWWYVSIVLNITFRRRKMEFEVSEIQVVFGKIFLRRSAR